MMKLDSGKKIVEKSSGKKFSMSQIKEKVTEFPM